jgi:hypothetical protein
MAVTTTTPQNIFMNIFWGVVVVTAITAGVIVSGRWAVWLCVRLGQAR